MKSNGHTLTLEVGHHHGHHSHGHSHGHRNVVRPIKERIPFSRIVHEIRQVLRHPDSTRISLFLGLNGLSVSLVSYWASTTNSLALSAYNFLTWFHILNLLTCYLTLWIENQSRKGHLKKSMENGHHQLVSHNSLGSERLEVLAVFSSSILSLLAAMFILKESTERLLDPPNIHTGRLMLAGIFCCSVQILTTYLAPGTALCHVIDVSQSSWLQEHTADLAQSICSMLPPLSSLLLPRINPMSLLSFIGVTLIFLLDIILEINNVHSTDCFVSIIFALFLIGTMHPFTMYTGRILLQTTPPHIVPQLERCLSEALTIPGVLEFKNKHFWTVSFGKLAGSLTIRIRRDADDQLVLAHVTNSLANLVKPLTIQITKDDHFLTKMQQQKKHFFPNHVEKVNAASHIHDVVNARSESPGMSPVNNRGMFVTQPPQTSFSQKSPNDHLMTSTDLSVNSSGNVLTSTPKGSEEIERYGEQIRRLSDIKGEKSKLK